MKQVKNANPFVIFILFIFSAGCGKPRISEEVLVKVYVENIIALETYAFNADSLKVHQMKVFNKYNITKKRIRAAA